MIKQIIKNEIKDALGHKATDAEYKSCLQYIQENTSDNTTLIDIERTIDDWKHNCCAKCQGCGEWFLTEEMEYDHFCSEQCKKQYEEDEAADMEYRMECQSRWNER